MASPAVGQWPTDPTVNVALCNAVGTQAGNGLTAVSSLHGGTISAWQDDRDSDNDIYAQRLSFDGVPLWPANGVPVCTAAGTQLGLQGVSDGAGGAILVWIDLRDGESDIYAQRIDPDGNLMWPVGSPSLDGVPVCATTEIQTWINVVSDGSGGAIVTWENGPSPNDIYAQRLDEGIVVTDAPGVHISSRIVSDGAGGAILVWTDGRNNPTTSYDIYAQRVDSQGDTLWPGDAPICVLANAQTYPAIAADGFGGAFMAWFDNEEIWAQHVNSSGDAQWPTNGILINDSSLDSQHTLRGVGSGLGSAIFVWQDLRNYATTGRDLYAQRLTTGGPDWTAGGVVISQALGDQRDPAIASPKDGSVVIAWVDGRSGAMTPDIYTLQILGGSDFSGPADGLAVCTADYGQWKPVVGTSGMGDAVLVWADSRNISTGVDIYAQGVFLTVIFVDDFESGTTSAWDSP
jgi:hypothetical protein